MRTFPDETVGSANRNIAIVEYPVSMTTRKPPNLKKEIRPEARLPRFSCRHRAGRAARSWPSPDFVASNPDGW